MTGPVISVPLEAMVYKVIQFMRQKGVRRVAVVAADGTLAGLLSQREILAYARRMGKAPCAASAVFASEELTQHCGNGFPAFLATASSKRVLIRFCGPTTRCGGGVSMA